jgi:hypothetical protein
MDLARFANFVWWMLTNNADEKDKDKLRAQLWRPARGTIVNDPRSPWSSQNEGNSFAALKTSMGGSAPKK